MGYNQVMNQLFPAVPRDSAWCTELLGVGYRNFSEFVSSSVETYRDMLMNTCCIDVNFLDFDNYAKQLLNRLQYGKTCADGSVTLGSFSS